MYFLGQMKFDSWAEAEGMSLLVGGEVSEVWEPYEAGFAVITGPLLHPNVVGVYETIDEARKVAARVEGLVQTIATGEVEKLDDFEKVG